MSSELWRHTQTVSVAINISNLYKHELSELKLFSNTRIHLNRLSSYLLDLLWVHSGVFNQSLVAATVGLLQGPLTCTSISISISWETVGHPNAVLHQMSWKWSLPIGIGLGKSKWGPVSKIPKCVFKGKLIFLTLALFPCVCVRACACVFSGSDSFLLWICANSPDNLTVTGPTMVGCDDSPLISEE